MRAPPKEGLVLGFQPASQGFGWAAFSSPLNLYDWGFCHDARDKNARCLRRLEKLFAQLNPEVIVLEAFEGRAKRSQRIGRLGRAVIALAIEQRIEVAIYTRGQIAACFASVGAGTRQEVAEAVARSFVELRPHLPRPRAAWDSPSRRMAIFDAAAAVQAHYQLCVAQLFDGLLSNG